MKKIFLISLIVLLSLFSASPAVAEIDQLKESLSDCGDTAKQSQQFFRTTIDTIDIVTPTVDLTKNYCQVEDLNTLENQVANAKRTVERAFEGCNPDKIESSKQDYYRLKIEQYYVHHFVESNSSDNSFFEKGENLEAVPFDTLYADMKERFVGQKRWMDETTLSKYLTEFQKKYTDRLTTYQNCKSGDWSALEDAFKNFWETIFSFNSAQDEIAQQKALRDRRHESGVKSLSDLGSDIKNRSGSMITDGLSKKAELRLNNVEPQKGLSEIGAGFESALPGGSWPWEYFSDDAKEYMGAGEKAPDFVGISGALVTEEQRYASDVLEAEMLSQYEVLYGESADDVTQALVSDLDKLRVTIHDTLEPLHGVDTATNRSILRQCLNK
ncbi:hypothetical protein HZA41_02115 [Candidatus Peregrinibacteria bacterium]|nr:hypothetical protein [Candidatus Peregrinibacteria bacterium]